jgi:copper chaperone CopZ
VSACGHCVEDKVAAVYDYAVVSKAQALHQHVAFVAIDGSFSTDARTRGAIADIVRTAEGVDRASVRVSLELAALSFAFDPKRASFAAIHRSVGRQLSRIGVRVSEIKILDGSARVPSTANR